MISRFTDTLALELAGPVRRLLSHPFLEELVAAKFNKEHLKSFAIQYYFYCEAFPRMLSAVAANTPDDETRMNIIVNLWEEHGEGDLARSHRALYRQFLEAFGLNQSDIRALSPVPPIAGYIKSCMDICQKAHFLEAMSFLGPGAEMFTGDEYKKILSGLHKYSWLGSRHMEFWEAHIEADDHHYEIMAAALDRWSFSEENRERMQSGAQKAVSMEYDFWTSIRNCAVNEG